MKKMITMCISLLIVLGMVFMNNNVIEAATDPSIAPADWAFQESSIPLHDAILEKYPTIDTNMDGYISIDEAKNTFVNGVITIDLAGLGITGTVEGIQYFSSDLLLNNNQLSGSLPTDMSENRSHILDIAHNNLSGEIPESIGNMFGLLETLDLSYNQLTGSIPETIGDISALVSLYLSHNLLTGEIPHSIGWSSLMANFDVSYNQLSGEVPVEIYQNWYNPWRISLNNNPELTGNVVEEYRDSYNYFGLEYLNISGTSMIQARPDVFDADIIVIYDNLAANLLLPDKTDIIEGLTQEDIDNAQESCDWISDPTEKQQWQDDIDLAQKLLDSKQVVEDLFTDPTHTDIPDDLTMDDVLAAEDLVTTLPDGEVKTELLEEIEKAKDMLSVKEEVNDLFTDDTHTDIPDDLTLEDIEEVEDLLPTIPDGTLKNELQEEIDKAKNMLKAKEVVDDLYKDDTTIKDDLIQEDIDDAQNIVDTLDDGLFKDELQARIDEAQIQLDARVIPQVPNKDVDMVNTNVSDTISTADTVNIHTYLIGLGMVIPMLWLLRKRKMCSK